MTKNKIVCSYCLLGIGYTSIIVSHLLKGKGIDSIVIGLSSDKAIFDLQLSICSISPIPIFPVKDSSLYQTLKLDESLTQSIVEINYTEIKKCRISDFNIQENSLAEFIYKNSPSLKDFELSLKQWGSSILTKPFFEVQNKIKRHYLSSNNNPRIGYLDGFTLYYHFMLKSNPNILHLNSIDKIDYQNKIIFADSYEIHYKKLVSTIPINHLLFYCKINDSIPLLYEGSYFLYFTHSSVFQANKIIYDCDLYSNILRVFSATEYSIVVQLPSYKKGKIVISDISKRLLELIPTLKELKFEKELFLPMSYPIEPLTDNQTLKSINNLKINSIIPFGRFGNWEYKDLHELNWEDIL